MFVYCKFKAYRLKLARRIRLHFPRTEFGLRVFSKFEFWPLESFFSTGSGL